MRVEYDSNNSGGSWWLSDQNWHDLEAAGWDVHWKADEANRSEWATVDAEGRWLGALATSAHRDGLSLRDAIAEWESVTGESSRATGCSCCGNPHYFTARDEEGKYVDSYSPGFPSEGPEYSGGW